MDRKQAEAIAQALMQEGLQRQQARRQRMLLRRWRTWNWRQASRRAAGCAVLAMALVALAQLLAGRDRPDLMNVIGASCWEVGVPVYLLGLLLLRRRLPPAGKIIEA
ncbi:MAG TPA: hypothetical protein DDZ67_03575 [Xanthomonadaceae bacterium]|nr:hypothetical protein [Xanthomonadaceae bacterium]